MLEDRCRRIQGTDDRSRLYRVHEDVSNGKSPAHILPSLLVQVAIEGWFAAVEPLAFVELRIEWCGPKRSHRLFAGGSDEFAVPPCRLDRPQAWRGRIEQGFDKQRAVPLRQHDHLAVSQFGLGSLLHRFDQEGIDGLAACGGS